MPSVPGTSLARIEAFALTSLCLEFVQSGFMTHPELLRLRDSIDNIDAALIHLLAERFKSTKAVGEYKATHNLPPADPKREAAQIARLRALAPPAGTVGLCDD